MSQTIFKPNRPYGREKLGLHKAPTYTASMQMIGSINKQDILEFSSVLAKAPGKTTETLLSPLSINQEMTEIKGIVAEAANRFNSNTLLIAHIVLLSKKIKNNKIWE